MKLNNSFSKIIIVLCYGKLIFISENLVTQGKEATCATKLSIIKESKI